MIEPQNTKQYVLCSSVRGCPEGAYLKWMWLDFQINVLQTRINEQQKLWVTVNEQCEPLGCCVVLQSVCWVTGRAVGRKLGDSLEHKVKLAVCVDEEVCRSCHMVVFNHKTSPHVRYFNATANVCIYHCVSFKETRDTWRKCFIFWEVFHFLANC